MRKLIKFSPIIAMVFVLVGCGQKGPLSLPEKKYKVFQANDNKVSATNDGR